MPFRSLEQGISAIQQGQHAEGARLLKIALKSPELKGSMRAMAYLWLAETRDDRQAKLNDYNDALAADPDNEHARTRIAHLMAVDLPGQNVQAGQTGQGGPAVSQSAPNPPQHMPGYRPDNPASGYVSAGPGYDPNTVYRTVGIPDGPNGYGTGFFITGDGLVATTRFVVGGVESVTIELQPGQTVNGRVCRAYPQLDLAFISTQLTINRLLTPSRVAILPERTPLTAVSHTGQIRTGERRATRSIMKQEWFPTTIEDVPDAGGAPIFDNQNLLVGMLTRNASRMSAYVFGLNISPILHLAEELMHEMSTEENLVYCPNCGYRSRAQAAGAFYCERCGSTLPSARSTHRFPLPQMAAIYSENIHRPCQHCGSRAGYYNGACLRCGGEIT